MKGSGPKLCDSLRITKNTSLVSVVRYMHVCIPSCTQVYCKHKYVDTYIQENDKSILVYFMSYCKTLTGPPTHTGVTAL